MPRVYGFLGGSVVGLTATYVSAQVMRRNTAKIDAELRLADDYARDRPKVLRPYTEPINLETRSWRDTVVDVWNREIVKAVQYLNSVSPK